MFFFLFSLDATKALGRVTRVKLVLKLIDLPDKFVTLIADCVHL